MSLSANELAERIDTCMTDAPTLSEWEVQFLDSISSQLRKYGSLSEKQTAKMNSIYQRTITYGD